MGESTATLALVIKAKDMASGQVSKLNKSLTNLKRGALDTLPLGFMGAAGAAALLTDQLVKGVKGAVEEEQSIGRLSAALKANVPMWDGDTDAVLKRLDAGLRLGFADDELRDSLAKLVPATRDVTEALQLQRTAMDLARLKGGSLEAASQALIDIDGGRYRALGKLIGSTKEITTQTQALAEVQRVAAGQAEVYMETTAGKLERLDNAWADLTETVGGLAIPVLEESAGYVQALSDAMGDGELTATQYREDVEALAVALDLVAPEFIDGATAAFKNAAAVEEAAQQAGELIAKSTIATAKIRGLTTGMGAAKDGTVAWRKSLVPLNNGLQTTGEIAAAIVADMIDIRREGEFLWEMSHGTAYTGAASSGNPKKPKKPKKKPKHAAGGWVGLNGPEDITVGERGPEYVTPNHAMGGPGRNGTGGVVIQGVSERELMDMVDRQLYFRLRRAGTA